MHPKCRRCLQPFSDTPFGPNCPVVPPCGHLLCRSCAWKTERARCSAHCSLEIVPQKLAFPTLSFCDTADPGWKTNLEVQKRVCVGETIRSIESLQKQLQIERSQLDLALQQYQPQGSWFDALETLTQELVEAEQQESDGRELIAHCLQRLEELDDQIQCTKDDMSLKISIQELRMLAEVSAHTYTPSDVQ